MVSLQERIAPVVDKTVRGVFGLQLPDLTTDISKTLAQTKAGVVDTSVPFKEAKRQFKKEFLGRLLSAFGSVTRVSEIAGIKRESVHRLMKQLDISTDGDLRHYMKENKVKGLIGECIDAYRTSLHPEKVQTMYEHIQQLSIDVVRELPEEVQNLDDAEEDWERAYLEKSLVDHDGNISATARTIGLRFETLHRKLKKLKIR